MIRQTCIAILLVIVGITIASVLILIAYLFSLIRKEVREIQRKEKKRDKRSSGKK